MLKKIPITLAAVSVVQGANLNQKEASNVQVVEDAEWNASIAHASKPGSSETVEISADQQVDKKHKKKHHKGHKHQSKNDKELVQSGHVEPQFNAKVVNFNVSSVGNDKLSQSDVKHD